MSVLDAGGGQVTPTSASLPPSNRCCRTPTMPGGSGAGATGGSRKALVTEPFDLWKATSTRAVCTIT
jgi:hypothetical protein